MTNEETTIIIAAVVLLIVQSTWLFLDARKRGFSYWFWGICGMIQAPLPLVCYLLFTRKIFTKRDSALD